MTRFTPAGPCGNGRGIAWSDTARRKWNEPNIGYWRGTREEFFALHDYAIAAVREVVPSARVGGPDVAGGPGGDFLQAFLEHCLRGKNAATGATGTPLDFIAFHAKGSPRYIEDHVRMASPISSATSTPPSASSLDSPS